MKKFLIGFLMLLPTPAFADTISISPFISGNDVTIAALETQRTTLSNVINGNIESVNIKDGTIASVDEAVSVSIVKFRDEAFNDFTFSGMLPVTDATLSSNISAGVSYVNGARIEKNAESHTYTASKDTYVYINAGGFYDFQEVALGASAPSTPINDLLLAKVVTSGTAITSVTDLRTTAIQITANSSNLSQNYRNEAFVQRDSTTAMHIEPGQIALGNTLYVNTAETSSRSTATSSNWIEGSVPNLMNQKFYVYAYNNAGTTFDFKFSSADPVYSDTSLNTGGTLRYYANGGTTYRLMGWVSGDATGTISTNAFGNVADGTIQNTVFSQVTAMSTGAVAIPYDTTTPLAAEGAQFLTASFRPTNANSRVVVEVTANVSCNAANPEIIMALFKDSDASAIATAVQEASGNNLVSIPMRYTMTAGTINPLSFRVRIGDNGGNTITFNGLTGAQKLNSTLASNIKIYEEEV